MKKNDFKGLFIVFEGLDGSGQSTQAALLKDFFSEKGKEVVLTKEPTLDSRSGKKLRKILYKEIEVDPREIQELMVQDRREHLENTIIPALKEGKTVVCDRYFFSTLAYGAADGLDFEWLVEINNQFLYPDIIFLLKVSPEVCMKRIMERGEEIALFEKKQKLSLVWEVYKALPSRFNSVYVIDGEKSIPKVSEQIIEIINKQTK